MKNNKNSVIVNDPDIYNKKIVPTPTPPKNIGIDVEGEFDQTLINAADSNHLDMATLESFTRVSQDRNHLYDLIDTMAEDTTIASILETYAEDSTETNKDGRIVYVESDDSNIGHYITFLLDTLNIDKNIYQWVYCLCKYGDVYLRLYRQSDFEDALFDNQKKKETLVEHFEKIDEQKEEKLLDDNTLTESVKINLYSKKDKYAHYVEMIPNPAEMFELTKLGKSYAYIQAKVPYTDTTQESVNLNHILKYSFNKSDVNIYDATNFVHACLLDSSSRMPEEVDIFLNDDMETKDAKPLTYRVKKGQSLLQNTFKVWRELMLLENSLLLNRITKSSIVRVIGVEVGDMPKEQVGPHLQGIKRLIEQKTAINTGNSMSEYTNPGPMENNVYVPTRGQIGTLNISQVGGDVDVKGIADIDHFKNRLFSGLRVPKQFFGETDDAAGFSGGESLSIISSRYAKMVKRIQTTILQAVTDIVNMMLFDKGLMTYINKFTLKMVSPTTQDDITRRDDMQSNINAIQDILGILDNYIEVPEQKLKAAKILLSGVIHEPDIINILQEEIEKLENEENIPNETEDLENNNNQEDTNIDINLNDSPERTFDEPVMDTEQTIDVAEEEPEQENSDETVFLPSAEDLGLDLTGETTTD